MKINVIVAVATNGVIGRDNALPWHLPTDLKNFKTVTMGKPVIMGRKTFESIGRRLPGRLNIVVTRNADFRAEGCTVAGSFDAALDAAGSSDEVFVIGGAQLYRVALPKADRLYLTRVEAVVEGNTFFPSFDPSRWRPVSSELHLPDETHNFSFRCEVWERV